MICPIRFRFFEVSLLGLPSKATVCAVSSSSSDLRKNGAASPNSFVSKRDMVATPRWPQNLDAPATQTSCGTPFVRKQSFVLGSVVLNMLQLFLFLPLLMKTVRGDENNACAQRTQIHCLQKRKEEKYRNLIRIN